MNSRNDEYLQQTAETLRDETTTDRVGTGATTGGETTGIDVTTAATAMDGGNRLPRRETGRRRRTGRVSATRMQSRVALHMSGMDAQTINGPPLTRKIHQAVRVLVRLF